MADSNKQFNATGRIPSRPLSYEYRDLAQPKELLVDYNSGIIYVVTATKEFINITDAIKGEISVDTSSIRNVEITLEDGSKVTVESGIIQALSDIGVLQTSVSDLSKTVTDNKEALDNKDTELANSISSLSDTVTANKKALDTKNAEQDASITALQNYNKTGVLILKTTISAESDKWADTDGGAPYKQTITFDGILETDYPVVDIDLSDDYDTAVDELDSYGRIMKILTFDGYIEVYATEPTSVALNIYMKTDRKSTN